MIVASGPAEREAALAEARRYGSVRFVLTGGRLHLAAGAISGTGRGGVPLTPDKVAGFAVALGIPASDLAVVIGVELVEPPCAEIP